MTNPHAHVKTKVDEEEEDPTTVHPSIQMEQKRALYVGFSARERTDATATTKASEGQRPGSHPAP